MAGPRRKHGGAGRAAVASSFCLAALAPLGAAGSAQAARKRSAPPAFFGVSAVHLEQGGFENMGAAAVGTYRMLLSWAGVQRGGWRAYDWSATDLEVAAAARNGMQVLPFVSGSPAFVAPTPATPPLGRLRDSFRLLLKKRRRWRVGRVIWFVCRDFDADVCRWCGSSGLPKRNGKPKPSLAQFTRIAAKGR